MKAIESMTKQELQTEICCNENGLYECFDEQKFLSDQYTHEELIDITTKWIMEAPEVVYQTA